MTRAGMLRRVMAAGLVLGWLSPAASADGLSRFEKAIKDAPPGTLTWKGAKSLGDTGFVLEDVVLLVATDKKPDAKQEPIPIKRLTVEDFDFDSAEKKLPPNFLKLRAEGIAIPVKPSEGVDIEKLTGIAKLTAEFQLDYRLDPERKTLTVNRVEFDLDGLARLELSMILDGITPDVAGKPDAAMNDASLRTATLTFEDRSLLSKVLPAAAKTQGNDTDAFVGIGKVMLQGLRKDQGPAALGMLDAVESYMDDYKAPKGPLRITLNPPAKTSAAALQAIKTPDDAVKALGLVVSYAGTRPHAAAAAAVSSDAKPGCTPGARFFVLNDDAWWSVTVREPTQSGEKCVGRIDGGDDDVTFALKETRTWSIDGPGKPVAECKKGDKIVALYRDGGWYPAKVTGEAVASKCPLEYEGDDSEDKVELKKVRRLD